MSNLFASEFEALSVLKAKQANARKGQTFTLAQSENGWWSVKASKPMKVTQDMAGKLCVNGKPVGELIQGLFKQCADSLSAFRLCDQSRFAGLMAEHGKEREASIILQFATQP